MKGKILSGIVVSVIFLLATVVSADEKRFDVPINDSPSMGPADAPVTIIEFLDYQ